MNKEELRDSIESLPATILENEQYCVTEILINQSNVLEIIDQLEETEKPVVPQFVADFIKSRKDRPLVSLFSIFANIERGKRQLVPSEIVEWIFEGENNDEIFARAWLYGYEVEETLYYMPLPYQSNSTIYYYKQDDGKISFKQGGMMKDHSKFTKEELDKYFPEIKHMAEEVQE